MTYTQKEYAEIFGEMLDSSLEKGLISHDEDFKSYIENQEDISNYYVMDKSVIAEADDLIYKDITEVYKSPKIDHATGSDLDDIGDIVGIIRPPATCAEVETTFSIEGDLINPITIPEGVIVSTNDNIRYVTLEEVYFYVKDQIDMKEAKFVELNNTKGVFVGSLLVGIVLPLIIFLSNKLPIVFCFSEYFSID